MRSTILSFATATALVLGAVSAQAMPAVTTAPGSDAAPIVTVAEGCGPGFHRNFRGFCRPNFGPRFGVGGPFGGPHCFVRDTFYGPRRICR
jgi:hypothetical protein